MAIASAKADARSIGTNILLADSGFLPIASIAFEPIIPIEIAGAIEPIPMASAFESVAMSIFFIIS